MGPGWTLLTVMPRSPTSRARPCVNILTAPLVAAVGDEAGRHHAFADAGADHDDAAAVVHVLERRLGGDEDAAEIEVDDAVEFFERGVFERLGDGGAGVVDEDVEPAEGGDGLFDRGRDGSASAASAWMAIAFPPARSIALTTAAAASAPFGVGDGDAGAVGGQAFGDRGADAARAAGDEGYFVWLIST